MDRPVLVAAEEFVAAFQWGHDFSAMDSNFPDKVDEYRAEIAVSMGPRLFSHG